MFFGLGWCLTSLVALNYFQSMIFPQNFMEMIYFFTTFIGHYGLMLSLLYFLFYCPVVLIFPTYYISRIWSLTLILSVNLFIFLDSYLFIKYRFHLNSFLGKLLLDDQASTYFGFTPLKIGLVALFLVIAFFIFWLRGERVWRGMQSRFSNPVKNWYLVLILICLASSNLIYFFSDANLAQNINRISNLFPLHYQWTTKQVSSGAVSKNLGYKELYYPGSPLQCQMKSPNNILMIVLDRWSDSDSLFEIAPNLNHYKSHGLYFSEHFSGGLDEQEGYFSIIYSMPGIYLSPILNESKPSEFILQMKKSNMDLAFFKDGDNSPAGNFLFEEKETSWENLEALLAERNALAKVNAFMTQVYLSGGSLNEKDLKVKKIISLFSKYKLLQNTIIAITGAKGNEKNLRTPMILIWPGQEAAVIEKTTSHYDILPTIMGQNWGCKNPTIDYSFGVNIFSKDLMLQHPVGTYKSLQILDFNKHLITTIDEEKGFNVFGLDSNQEVNKVDFTALLKTLEKLTLFYQR